MFFLASLVFKTLFEIRITEYVNKTTQFLVITAAHQT